MAQYGLLTFQSAQGPRAGIAAGGKVVDAAKATGNAGDASVQGILDDWAAAQGRLEAAADKIAAGSLDTMDRDGLTLLSPVHWPVSLYCAGANYSDHVAAMAARQGLKQEADPKESGLNPWHFLKPARTAVGDKADIFVVSASLDWEIELAAVIGTKARNVSVGDALNYVAGYTIANDLSARDLSRRPGLSDTTPFKWDWIGQKCFDGSCPLGPVIVPASQIADPMNLPMRLYVNDELKQNSNSGNMIFTIADQIAHLSTRLTLHPGDIVLTGTPAGTGAESGTFLKSGDVVRAEIDGLGALTTYIRSIDSNEA
ncbi:MAG: fumarylacetoacetate hydrolase family protein [Hyphomicrobiales bacterium]|nr:fumarylacetoacetate hydrolase family protein [Hyphomicrobiales bacterium]